MDRIHRITRPAHGAWLAAALISLGALTTPVEEAQAFPVASDPISYTACGRVFPDPHAYWPAPNQAEAQSPWAKGNATCRAVDFLPYEMTLEGLEFLASEEMFGEFIEIYDLSDRNGPYAAALNFDNGEGMSAGLPTTTAEREQVPMYMIRVTDEAYTGIPIEDREHFVFTLSIHGIESAGREGGIRAIEDLATWASCEKHGDASPANCAQEGAGPNNPRPILETLPGESITAGDALRQSSVWFVLSNPDGWRRGTKQEGRFAYQRYNGNGMDMNRDWPTKGWTFRPFTPWSEPENRTTGKALKAVKEKWSGGVDLHGQIIDRAFSFTLIGGAERPFGKDRRVLQYVKGAWADAEQKLSWNPLIKGNDEPEPCVFGTGQQSNDPNCDPTNRIYGVQWGTIWDTIDYTVSGALGDWIDSPLGLDADGIDNEMSLSHLGTCGTGTCYLPDFEQLHVDGNKSLIYGMIHYTMEPEDQTFHYDGKAAYFYNPRTISDAGSSPDPNSQLGFPRQRDDSTGMQIHTGGSSVYEFTVSGPAEKIYNGGLYAEFTFTNFQGQSAGTANEVAIDRFPEEGEEIDPERGIAPGGWQVMNSYFNQSVAYAQGGARIDVNGPPPGRYRLRVTGAAPVDWSANIVFTNGPAWPDPGQLPFEATNMKFFEMLQEFVPNAAERLVPVEPAQVLAGEVDLTAFDTVIVADDAFLPGTTSRAAGSETSQLPISDTVTVPPPVLGERLPQTTANYEFTVESEHSWLEAFVSYPAAGNMDVYLQQQNEDGSWSGDLVAGDTTSNLGDSLVLISPQAGTYRLQVVNVSAPSQSANVEIHFQGLDDAQYPSDTLVPIDRSSADNVDTQVSARSVEERDALADIVRGFVEQGGNLVLTDNSIQALRWMGLVTSRGVNRRVVYAGHVQFEYEDGGETIVTYDDPLNENVDQPGSAEGTNHRHQVIEPIPIGYAIENLSGADMPSIPQWYVTRQEFDNLGGRIGGTLGTDVTLGEIPLGDGVIRVIGSLLTFPTDKFDHPYGVGNYALTWTGYELAQNLFSWTNPNGTSEAPVEAGSRTQPTQQGVVNVGGSWAPLTLIVLGALLLWRRRR